MEALYLIAALIGGIVVGLFVARAVGLGRSSAARRAAEAEAKKLVEAAAAEVTQIKKSAHKDAEEIKRRIKGETESDIDRRRSAIEKQDRELKERERAVDKQVKEARRLEGDLARREKSIGGREQNAESAVQKAEAAQDEAKAKLAAVAGMSRDAARDMLVEEMRQEARTRVADEIADIEKAAQAEARDKANTIIATSIQRYASEFVGDSTTTAVPIPSDDMKGRLIGREGRNIRALEAAAGIDMIIDDTSEMITISCFNPVRREIGRLTIEKLVSDGRIHPTRIEEVVGDAEKKIAGVCKEAGEQAVFDLGLHKVHPELVKRLGELKFRQSFAQNVLAHSIEVGYLAGLMAAELGMSVKAARRAGLLHDIGKSGEHEYEGSHAEAGAQLARKHGESPRICQAIARHHGEPAPLSVLDHIIDAANRLSGARPGARRETLASYIKRLEDLEELAASYTGVTRAYAILAGREVRVMVQNDKVSDAEAKLLSKEIARRIEEEATYAGQVRVVVLRETRASEYAQ